MPYILNIHTATETAIINLCSDKEIVATAINRDQKQHASFLHAAIHELLQKAGIDIKKLSAVGVSSGPGSYTGIRVGLASAKGLCYALHIPLITFTSLEIMAYSASRQVKDKQGLYCPMIDARRMEVYTALYNYNLQELEPASAMVLNEKSFSEILTLRKIFFSGNGSYKFKNLLENSNTSFINAEISSESLAKISWQKFEKNGFENITYAKPLYIKDFHTIFKK